MSEFVSSYDYDAPKPKVGSKWIWEKGNPRAEEVVVVQSVDWNGEEWWVSLSGAFGTYPNDLSRFWEACTPWKPSFKATLPT